MASVDGQTFSVFVYEEVLISDYTTILRLGDFFSPEDIAELVELGRVVRIIRTRLISEGKFIGKIE